MQDAINKIFLTYANNFFVEDPENIRKVFKVIQYFEQKFIKDINLTETYYEPSSFLPDEITPVIDEILRLAECDYRKALDIHTIKKFSGGEASLVNELKEWPFVTLSWHNIAFKAIYRHNCKECQYNVSDERKNFHQDYIPKCYECDQMEFISLIDSIIDGYEYDFLPGFVNYLIARNENVVSIVDVANSEIRARIWNNLLSVTDDNVINFPRSPGASSKASLKERKWFSTRHFFRLADSVRSFYYMRPINPKYAFSQLLMVFVGYSLIEFLLNNDRRKLKKCKYCHIYFIADDIRRQKCYSDDCKHVTGL